MSIITMTHEKKGGPIIAMNPSETVLTGGDSAGIGDQLGFTFLPRRRKATKREPVVPW